MYKYLLLAILIASATADGNGPMAHYTSGDVPTPWIGEQKLVDMLSSVIVDNASLQVESYRLVSQKLQRHCRKETPPYTHCRSYNKDGICQCSAFFKAPVAQGEKCATRNPDMRN